MSGEDKEVVRDYEVGGVVETEAETTTPEPEIIEREIIEEAPKEVVKEAPIEYLKSPVNGRIFPVNKSLIKRKDLVPCDKCGKKVPDNRRFGRFN